MRRRRIAVALAVMVLVALVAGDRIGVQLVFLREGRLRLTNRVDFTLP